MNPKIRAEPSRQRSSIAPVGMVTATSRSAAWKKKTARIAPDVASGPSRPNPRDPARSHEWPNALTETIDAPRGEVQGWRVGKSPCPPNIQANPQTPKPRTVTAKVPSVKAAECAAFLARARPVSARVNPAFISQAKAPAATNQAMLAA